MVKGRVVTFEGWMKAGETTRRTDVVSKIGKNGTPVYYEFKSVATIPPNDFAEQFLKDLEIAGDLSQIKWYFDGQKISKLEKEVFLKELEKVEIGEELIKKWINNPLQQSKDYFINFVSDNFDTIFEIK